MKIILEKTIKSLSKKEIINYKLYANRHSKIDNRKDIALFDAIRNGTSNKLSNDTKKDIYKEKNNLRLRGFDSAQPPKANTIRKLKVRLLNEIGTSLVQFYFHENSNSTIYNDLNLFDIFYQKNEWEIAHYHLQQAEKMAIKTQNFKLLGVIYNEFIKLSVYFGTTTPQVYISKRNLNENNIKDTQLFDDAVNSVRYELQRNFALIKTSKILTDTLAKIIGRLERKNDLKNNLIFQHKLFDAISRLLIAQREFKTLETYCIKVFKEFSGKNYFTKETHGHKLQILCYICNSLHENKKNKLALEYLTSLHKALSEYGNLLKDNYVFFYYNSMANNYTVLNPSKAIDVLLEAKEVPAILNNNMHLFYIYWNLAGVYFDSKLYKNSLKNIIILKELESFVQLSPSLQLHITVFEIVLRIDLKQGDYVQKSIRSVFKNFNDTLIKPEHQRDFGFLSLIKKTYTNTTLAFNTNNIHYVNEFVSKIYVNQNKNIVDYNKWLTEKIKL